MKSIILVSIATIALTLSGQASAKISWNGIGANGIGANGIGANGFGVNGMQMNGAAKDSANPRVSLLQLSQQALAKSAAE